LYIGTLMKGIKNIVKNFGEIVYQDNEYKITFDHEVNNGTHIILLYEDKMVGLLNVGEVEINDELHYYIRGIVIDPRHRNKGYGTKMYKALIDNHDNRYEGIASYLNRRLNTEEIPDIYKKFGAVREGDYATIKFENL